MGTTFLKLKKKKKYDSSRDAHPNSHAARVAYSTKASKNRIRQPGDTASNGAVSPPRPEGAKEKANTTAVRRAPSGSDYCTANKRKRAGSHGRTRNGSIISLRKFLNLKSTKNIEALNLQNTYTRYQTGYILLDCPKKLGAFEKTESKILKSSTMVGELLSSILRYIFFLENILEFGKKTLKKL